MFILYFEIKWKLNNKFQVYKIVIKYYSLQTYNEPCRCMYNLRKLLENQKIILKLL